MQRALGALRRRAARHGRIGVWACLCALRQAAALTCPLHVLHGTAGATPDCLAHLAKVLEYVQHTYPYWNRTDGKDHFLVRVCGAGRHAGV